MPETHLEDVFDPEVATAVATAEFPNELAANMPGAPFVVPFPPQGELRPGASVKFPRWQPVGDFTDLNQGTTLSPEAMSQEQDFATVIAGGKAVEIDDWTDLAGAGDPSEEAGRQFAEKGARYVDDKLVDEAQTTPLGKTYSQEMTWDVFVDAIIDQWGDKAMQQVGGIIVHSKQMGDLMTQQEFTKANELGDASAVTDGFVGMMGRYPVFVSDRVPSDTSASPNTYTALVMKQGALGLKFQRTLQVESDRDVLNKSDVLSADVRFAPHLMFADPMPAITVQTQ